MAEQQQYQVEFFVLDFHGNRVSCGKYRTCVENYVLCVALPEVLEVSDIRYFHLEFSGKVSNPTCLSQESDKPI